MDKLTGRNHATLRAVIAIALSACGSAACSSEDEGDGMSPSTVAGMNGASGAASGGIGGISGASGLGGAGGIVSAGAGGTAGVAGIGGASGMTGGVGGMMLGGAGGMDAAGAGGAVEAGAGGGGGTGAATGPKDGDPSAPVVELADVPCRTEAAVAGGGFMSSINATVAGRELAVDYPCGKHEGAHMTVILNLHGTLIMSAPFLYQRNYFSAHRLIHSHNLIVLTPQSVSMASAGAQWGNQDGGADLPYLNDLINWVYTSFDKFQIQSTWVAGHSWGALYAAGGFSQPGFVCNEMFRDKLKGVIGMSRLSTPPCAERVAMIGTRGSEEDIPLLDQDSVAMQHGCDLPMKGPEMVGNNEHWYYEGCDPGFVHDDYNMLGKGHVDSIDAEVVLKIVESVKSTEL